MLTSIVVSVLNRNAGRRIDQKEGSTRACVRVAATSFQDLVLAPEVSPRECVTSSHNADIQSIGRHHRKPA